MGVIEISLIGLGLAMDATAVSMSNCMTESKIKLRKILLIAFMFGLFQAIMPTIGYFAGSTFSDYFQTFDHWVAFILLALIGGKMLWDAIKGSEDDEQKCNIISLKLLFAQAIATSIDALAVGVSLSAVFSKNGGNIALAVAIIGFITFICCVIACYVGKKFGNALSKKAEIFGGIILILIGLKILIEHLIAG